MTGRFLSLKRGPQTGIMNTFWISAASLILGACATTQNTAETLKLMKYQDAPLENPKGGEKFKVSNFIHPLKTPSGFTVTASNAEP